MNVSRKSGLYIHIPFCISKCGYCDFYSIIDTSLANTFTNALLDEIRLTAYSLKTKEIFDTIYIGGGTPSLLKPDQISSILETLSDNLTIDDNCEITCEINPGTLDAGELKELLALGINRISIGVQSFNHDELIKLERIHSVDESVNAISDCREVGFENINLDLIFAIPDQTLSKWNYTLKKALSFLPEHMSVYNLTYEQGTPFYRKMMDGQIVRADEQKEISFYTKAHSLLNESGYIHYEVSNYARTESDFSRHNYKYWQHIPYLGFGPSAHSFWENSRWANINSVHEYITKIRKAETPHVFNEKLEKHQLMSEHILLALRTYQGLSLIDFENLFGMNFLNKFARETEKLIENKLAIVQEEYFRLTDRGILVCDEILLQFTIEKDS